MTTTPTTTTTTTTETDHKTHVVGRQRRTSEVTHVLGHLGVRKSNPQPTWIAAVVTLKTNPGIDRLREVLLERMLTMPRFRSRFVARRMTRSYYEEVPVDVGYHFEVVGYGKKCTEADVNAAVEGVKRWNYHVDKPLWKVMHLPEMEDGTSTVVFVIHHAIGDGVGLVDALMRKIIDPFESAEVQRRASHSGQRKTAPQFSFGKRVRITMYGIYEGNFAPFFPQDKPNPLKLVGKPSDEKLIAKSDSINLAQVKEMAKKIGQGVSVNDVLMALFSKTIRTYFEKVAGEPREVIEKRKMRAQFPINLRGKKGNSNKYGDPNNYFSFGYFPLPLRYTSSTDLILKVKAEIDEIKVSPASKIALGNVPFQLKTLPLPFLLDVLENSSNIATAMLSNVPGPQVEVSLAGVPVLDFGFYLFALVGLYVGVLSYNGKVSCTVNMDAKIGVDPKDLAKLWLPCFEEMYKEICT